MDACIESQVGKCEGMTCGPQMLCVTGICCPLWAMRQSDEGQFRATDGDTKAGGGSSHAENIPGGGVRAAGCEVRATPAAECCTPLFWARCQARGWGKGSEWCTFLLSTLHLAPRLGAFCPPSPDALASEQGWERLER